MNLFDQIIHPIKPKPAPTPEEIAAQQTQVLIDTSSASAAAIKPSCLNKAAFDLASTLCAQRRAAGQEAVAAYSMTGFGAVEYDAAIRAAPCDWAQLPFCGDAFKRTPTPSASSPSPSPTAAKPSSSAKASSEIIKPSSAVSPPAVAPRDDKWLIIGGVLLGAVALGGVYYYMKES